MPRQRRGRLKIAVESGASARKGGSGKKKGRKSVAVEDDEEDEELPKKKSTGKKKGRKSAVVDDDEEELPGRGAGSLNDDDLALFDEFDEEEMEAPSQRRRRT